MCYRLLDYDSPFHDVALDFKVNQVLSSRFSKFHLLKTNFYWCLRIILSLFELPTFAHFFPWAIFFLIFLFLWITKLWTEFHVHMVLLNTFFMDGFLSIHSDVSINFPSAPVFTSKPTMLPSCRHRAHKSGLEHLAFPNIWHLAIWKDQQQNPIMKRGPSLYISLKIHISGSKGISLDLKLVMRQFRIFLGITFLLLPKIPVVS